jgi:hypothetical protein
VRVFPGWPLPDQLQKDMLAGIAQVSVFPLDIESRVPHNQDWAEIPRSEATVSVSVTGDTLTLSGTPSYPLNVGLIVDKVGYVYPLQSSDGLSTVAESLAMLVAADRTATSSGASVTVPNALELDGRVGQLGTTVRELKRQKRVFQTTVWAPTPGARDKLSEAIDAAFARRSDITLPDGLSGLLQYDRSPQTDELSKLEMFRRDIRYSVEWATTESLDAPAIMVNETKVSAVGANLTTTFES